MTPSPIPRRLARTLAALALLAAPALPRTARAQFAIDKTELTLVPGDSASRTALLLVRNEGAQRAQATLKVEDWDRSEDGANRFYTAGTHPGSCAKGLTVFPMSVTLAPGESQYVRISYDPAAAGDRPGAAARECWSVVLVEHSLPRPDANGRTLFYTLRTGAKVYVEPSGLTRDGQVNDVAIRPGSDGARAAEVTFQNIGTRHVVAKGRLEFRRADNTVAASVPLPDAYALPGATARTKATLPAIAQGRYVVLAVLDYGGSELAAAQLEYEVP